MCDASSIITLLESCMFELFEDFSNDGVTFIIPEGVQKEMIDRPSEIRRFMFTALRAKEALKRGVFSLYSEDVRKEAERIGKIINSAFTCGKESIQILHQGELESLIILKGMDTNMFLIDEKATRFLLESPEKIRRRLEEKLRRKVRMDPNKIEEIHNEFGEIEIIRSAELVAMGFKKRYMKGIPHTPASLEGALYRIRVNGCSITDKEIKEYPKLVFRKQ